MGQHSHLYGSRWRKERAAFLRANPLCRLCKEQSDRAMPASVVDHKIAHRGDMRLFWDRSNWQPLCFTHHNAHAQQRDKSGTVRGCDVNGLPLDPQHHWNQPVAAGTPSDPSVVVRSPDLARSDAADVDPEGGGADPTLNGSGVSDRWQSSLSPAAELDKKVVDR